MPSAPRPRPRKLGTSADDKGVRISNPSGLHSTSSHFYNHNRGVTFFNTHVEKSRISGPETIHEPRLQISKPESQRKASQSHIPHYIKKHFPQRPEKMPPKPTPKSGGGGGGTFTYCVGSNPPFTPEEYNKDPARRQRALDLLAKNDLYSATVVTFNLPERDTYVYHAMTAVRLAEVQRVVSMGGVNGLHAWYRDEEGKP
ncbi:hypothetical protein CSAL01_08343, partial [Colletotrichum salicis]